MSDLPPPEPPADDRFAIAPTMVRTAELLDRIRRLLLVMVIVAIVLAVLPVPAFVPVVLLLAAPMFVLVVAISANDFRRQHFVWRYTRTIWEYRRDPAYLAEAAERAAEPVRSGLRRAWLLLGLFVAVFLVGLVLAGLSAGASEAIYG